METITPATPRCSSPPPSPQAVLVALAFAWAGTGCTTKDIVIHRSDLYRHSAALERGQRVRAESVDGTTVELTVAARVDVSYREKKLFGIIPSERHDQLPLNELTRDCPPVAPFLEDAHRKRSTCKLSQINEEVVVGKRRVVDWSIVGSSIYGVTLASSGLCAASCGGTAQDVSQWTLIGLSIPVLVIGVILLAAL